MTETTKVLIVGAGPSGLMMAAQLLRYGIQPVIVDSREGPTNHSKALAVQARSLEIYRQMGLADKAIAEGEQGAGVVFNNNGKPGAKLAMNNIGEGHTPFPYILMYPQSKNERLLLDYLTQHTCPVYWSTTVNTITQNANNATVTLSDKDGEHTLTADWVVGADGAHSIVRKQSGMHFKGDTYAHTFYLIDAKIDADFLTEKFINLYYTDDNFTAFFPMPDKDTYRVLGALPDELIGKEEITIEDVLPSLEKIVKAKVRIEKNNWFTTYKLHHRMAENFRQRRCFLIGDAAHIHSPVGGQGMNTGLQDAYNLAWKLAGVVNEKLSPVILDTYAKERMPVAKSLLRTTDSVFNIIMSKNWFSRFFKNHIMLHLLNTVWKNESLKMVFFKTVSQIGISYRHSPITLHLSNASAIKAGDRLPYVKFYDEKQQEETDLHQWCSKPGFTLIVMGRFEELFLFNIARWITARYQGMLNFYYLPPTGKNLSVFDAFHVNPHGQMALIVRPDMYIGFMNDTVDMNSMESYLRRVVGL